MWTTAHGVVVGEDLHFGCANAILQYYASWWYRYDPSRRSAYFGQMPDDIGQHSGVEQIWVSRPDMAVRRVHWARSAEEMYALVGEEIVKPGITYNAGRHQFNQVDGVRFFQGMQETRTEEEIQIHAWYGHGFAAMALLRPGWMLHGRRVIEEWADELDGVPVVRQRTKRVIPFDDPRMMGDDLNPTVMDHADEVVFTYDLEHDVIREWHDVWEGKPCTSYHIQELTFSDDNTIGEPFVIRRMEDEYS